MEMLTDEKIIEQGRARMKKWLKMFALFLAVMWVLTIVSRSIYLSKLPRVGTQTAEQRYIEHIVEADGIVVSGGERAVNTLSGLRVLGLNVQEGDYVEEDDLLFTIDLDDLANIISDREAELTRLQYQLSDTQFNQVLNIQKQEISVLWAQEDYETADKETLITVQRAEQALRDAEAELAKHLAEPAPYTSDSDRQAEWDNYNSWKNSGYDISDRISAKQREIAELEEQLQELSASTQSLAKSAEGEDTEGDGETDTYSDDDLNKQIEELRAKIKNANNELASLTDELTAHDRNTVLQPDFSAEELEYDTWQKTKAALEDAVHLANQNLDDTIHARNMTLQQKLRDIANAAVLRPADSTASIYELQISQMNSELAKLYLLRNQNGEIKAENSGFVSKIQLAVGGRTTDTAALLLTDGSVPCQFKFSITKEDGKYLHLNDTFELKLSGVAGTLEAAADYYTENNLGGYDVICKLPDGIGQVGASGSIKKTVQGELHNQTIPVDAIITDQYNATYVYVLSERSGILGSEYYVTRIKVQVKDQNTSYAALTEGAIGKDTPIITSYTEEISQGTNVRAAD